MGVSSPFVGPVSGPVLSKSKQATPLLEPFEGIENAEVFELCPPLLDLLTKPEEAEAPALAEKQQRPAVPKWPEHLPDCLHQFCEMNTFVDVPPPCLPEEERRRAGSDFTGLKVLEQSEVDVTLESLLEPLPPSPSTPSPSQEQSEEPMFWIVPNEYTGEWMMMYKVPVPMQEEEGRDWSKDYYSAGWAEPEEDAVRLPPMPERAEDAFKPKWVYGSSWPFNHAPTTLILENLPSELTQHELLNVLDASGFRGLYDFVFMPTSLRSGRSHGHAVVNLVRHSYGLQLAARAQGFCGWSTPGESWPCEVKWSLPLQGLQENVESYRNHAANHGSVPEAFRPCLFQQGWPMPFPAPTLPLRPPHMGRR